MPRIADYVVIRDSSFELTNNARNFSFDVHSDLVDRSDSKPVLTFNSRPLDEPLAVLQINVNSPVQKILEMNVDLDAARGFSVVFPASYLRAGLDENNVVTFWCKLGRIRISDVVLWYQRNIPD